MARTIPDDITMDDAYRLLRQYGACIGSSEFFGAHYGTEPAYNRWQEGDNWDLDWVIELAFRGNDSTGYNKRRAARHAADSTFEKAYQALSVAYNEARSAPVATVPSSANTTDFLHAQAIRSEALAIARTQRDAAILLATEAYDRWVRAPRTYAMVLKRLQAL
jgi:hypothetical protein